MREIKFRVWNKELEFMVMIEPISHIKWFLDNTFYFDSNTMESESFRTKIEDVILMQYTGLKDKNGKEIYESDIIDTDYGTSIVFFEDGRFRYEFSLDIDDLHYVANECKIIGNIHENPELLK